MKGSASRQNPSQIPVDGSPGQRWDHRYAALEGPDAGTVAPFLEAMASHVPTTGAALDVGGGLGANARWLAARGLQTTLLDGSQVGLDLARGFDPNRRLHYLCRDVEAEGLPPGQWDVILFHLFYDRALVEAAADHLTPGGVLLVCQPTHTNLERHDRPSRRFLLAPGEVDGLADGFADAGMDVVEAGADWRPSGRHDAWLVIRRPRR